MSRSTTRLLIAALLLLLAAVSFLYIGDWASAPETHAAAMDELQGKMDTVLQLSAAAAVTSAAVSALPGDTATPIAEKLADFTVYFLAIFSVLMAEKYIVTILGAAAFRILIPLALVLAGISLFLPPRRLRAIALRLAVIGLCLFLLVPMSLRVSNMIYRSYDPTIRQTMENAEQLSDDAAGFSGAEGDGDLLRSLTGALRTWRDRAADALNRFVETLAVMVVTSCVIPILVLLFFLWLIRQLARLIPDPVYAMVFRPDGSGDRRPPQAPPEREAPPEDPE